MPVAAVAGAVLAGAEIAAGTLTLMGTIGAVGSVVSAVGAITGDEDLMKIGGIASLAGGIGSFAAGQGWLDNPAVADTSGWLGNGTDGVTPPPTVPDTTTGNNIRTGAESSYVDTTPIANAPSKMSTGQTPGNDLGLLNYDQGQGPVDLVAGNAEPPKSINGTQTELNSDANPLDKRLANGSATAPQAGKSGGLASITDTLQKFANLFKNKDGSFDKTALAVGAHMIGGMFDKQKAANAALAGEQAATLSARRANANAIPSLSGMGVSSSPVFRASAPTYTAPRVGLLNS